MSTALETAKIFTTGGSQAVRLPKAYRFATSEVTIERQGNALVLRPKLQTTDKEAWWDEMDKILANFEGMPFDVAPDRRPNPPSVPTASVLF
jgi:antitoxin VapB